VALIKCWAVLGAPAGKRLAPMLEVLVPILRRDGQLDLSDDEAALLVAMSAAMIDRRPWGAGQDDGARTPTYQTRFLVEFPDPDR